MELYVQKIHNLGHPLTKDQLKLIVARITQTRPTPFKNGIPGEGWMRWFLNRHPELTFQRSQGLDMGKARGLSKESALSFYSNLELLFGRNGGGMVIERIGARNIHSIILEGMVKRGGLCQRSR